MTTPLSGSKPSLVRRDATRNLQGVQPAAAKQIPPGDIAARNERATRAARRALTQQFEKTPPKAGSAIETVDDLLSVTRKRAKTLGDVPQDTSRFPTVPARFIEALEQLREIDLKTAQEKPLGKAFSEFAAQTKEAMRKLKSDGTMPARQKLQQGKLLADALRLAEDLPSDLRDLSIDLQRAIAGGDRREATALAAKIAAYIDQVGTTVAALGDSKLDAVAASLKSLQATLAETFPGNPSLLRSLPDLFDMIDRQTKNLHGVCTGTHWSKDAKGLIFRTAITPLTQAVNHTSRSDEELVNHLDTIITDGPLKLDSAKLLKAGISPIEAQEANVQAPQLIVRVDMLLLKLLKEVRSGDAGQIKYAAAELIRYVDTTFPATVNKTINVLKTAHAKAKLSPAEKAAVTGRIAKLEGILKALGECKPIQEVKKFAESMLGAPNEIAKSFQTSLRFVQDHAELFYERPVGPAAPAYVPERPELDDPPAPTHIPGLPPDTAVNPKR